MREIGLEPIMASAIADRHASVAELARSGVFTETTSASGWRECADMIEPGLVG